VRALQINYCPLAEAAFIGKPDDGSRAPTPRAFGFILHGPSNPARLRASSYVGENRCMSSWTIGQGAWPGGIFVGLVKKRYRLRRASRSRGSADLEKARLLLRHGRRLMRAIEARKLAPGPRQTTPSPEAPAGTSLRRATRSDVRSPSCLFAWSARQNWPTPIAPRIWRVDPAISGRLRPAR